MKQLINTGRPVVMTTNREPLDLQLSIKQRNGDPLTQTQDYTAGAWSPNRNTTPLVLDVEMTAYDPEKKANISIGKQYINWYVGEEKAWDANTETGMVNTNDSTQNFFLEYVGGNKTGSLVVRKNVDYSKPIVLICVVAFTDSSRSEPYRIEQTVTLTAENRPDEFYTVKIESQSVVEYRPFTDATSARTLKAVAFRGNQKVEFPFTNGIKFFWYYMDAGVWTLIPTDGTYAPYVSGQNTDTLTLDAAYIDHEMIKVMMAVEGTYTAVASPTGNPKTNGYFERLGSSPNYIYSPTEDTSVATGKAYYELSQPKTAPDAEAFYRVEVARVIPRIEALPYCTGGSAVEVGDKDRTFLSIVTMDGQDMPDALRNEYIRLNWKSKPTNSNTVTDRGVGNQVSIPASQLMNTGSVNTEVYVEIGLLGPLELLIDDSPGGSGLVEDDSGSATASDNHGYCVGRS